MLEVKSMPHSHKHTREEIDVPLPGLSGRVAAVGGTQDVAALLAFLHSDGPERIDGQVIYIDGGTVPR